MSEVGPPQFIMCPSHALVYWLEFHCLEKLFTVLDSCTRTAHQRIDETRLQSVFGKITSVFETLFISARIGCKYFFKSTGNITSQMPTMAASIFSGLKAISVQLENGIAGTDGLHV